MARAGNVRLEWTVNGPPMPQKRHRHTQQGRVWDPSNKDKQKFLQCSKQACSDFAVLARPFCDAIRAQPLRVCLQFVFARPKSHYTSTGKLSSRAPAHHVRTPDADNLAKFVLDSLSGVFFKDDRQVCDLRASKEWGSSDYTRVIICACE